MNSILPGQSCRRINKKVLTESIDSLSFRVMLYNFDCVIASSIMLVIEAITRTRIFSLEAHTSSRSLFNENVIRNL